MKLLDDLYMYRRGPSQLLVLKDCMHVATCACAMAHSLNNKKNYSMKIKVQHQMTPLPPTDGARFPASYTYVRRFQ